MAFPYLAAKMSDLNKANQKFQRTGYSKVPEIINTSFNIMVSIILIILALPFFIIIPVLIKCLDGGSIFYISTRLGLNKKTYPMYKFRTLVEGADKIIGAQLLSRSISEHQRLETKIGTFLRDTRLDELPQLFNVLLGHMDLVGPRPNRPEIYEKFCANLRGYDKRFSVRPGLIGYSQMFTPHGAPKRIRTYIDNKFLNKKQQLMGDILFIIYAFGILLKKTILKIKSYFIHQIVRSMLLKKFVEKRTLERILHKQAFVYFSESLDYKNADFKWESKLIDLNEEALLVYSNYDFDLSSFLIKLVVPYKTKRGIARKHSTVCSGEIYRKFENQCEDFKYKYVIRYKSISSLNDYMVQQYFLFDSIAGQMD